MKQIVIGMSGHIDHGKTSIIKSLTGTNPERHSEELERGMTIDIGFAFLTDTITIIDVPGHEKFVKNMMAGSSGIDVAILVVAADDGVMPQTREHLEILKLLNINLGLVVLNKVDLVDKEWIELVVSDIKETVKDSFLDGSNIIKVSTTLESGIDILFDEIINISNLVEERSSNGLFRMPVDRVFSMKGFGTVVTGTVMSGKIAVNDNIEILPGNKKAKVRGLQTHQSSTQSVRIGDRAALNLQNVNMEEVDRGSHIVESNYYNMVSNIGVFIRLLDSSQFEIHQNQRLRIHIGTNEVMGRVSLTNHKILKSGDSASALLKLENPIVAAYKDRFIIRLFSPIITIGGGEIIDVDINGKWASIKSHLNSLYNADRNTITKLLIEKYGINPLTTIDASRLFNLSSVELECLINNSIQISRVEYKNYSWVLTQQQISENKKKLLLIITDFHGRKKYRQGMSKEEILQLVDSSSNYIDLLIDELIKDGKIENKNNVIFISNHKIDLSDKEHKIKEHLFNILNEEKFSSSDYSILADKLNAEPEKIKLLLSILEDEKLIIRLEGSLMFTKKNFDILKNSIIEFFVTSHSLSVNEFKDISNTSRKYAIPLLEYFDKLKITYRDGNCRRLCNNE